MFHRMFGRRKSPVQEDEAVDAAEAVEEKPEEICNDGFVVIDDPATRSNGLDPPPGYTVQGANAFLPYNLNPNTGNHYERSISFEGTSAIDGVPFKFGSKVLLEESMRPFSTASVDEMMSKIKSFNWDDYEYSFELERSIMREFGSTHYNHT